MSNQDDEKTEVLPHAQGDPTASGADASPTEASETSSDSKSHAGGTPSPEEAFSSGKSAKNGIPPYVPSDVPLYRTQPVMPAPPERPTGASVPTIVLGIIVAIIGIFTIVAGTLVENPILSFVTLRNVSGYAFAALGLLLSVVAIVWGISSAISKRRGNAS